MSPFAHINYLEAARPLRKEALLVISLNGLSVYLTMLYTHAPAMAPTTGANKYIHIPLYSPCTKAGPRLLAGFIDAPVTGLPNMNNHPQEYYVLQLQQC